MKYKDNQIAEAVAVSRSWAEVHQLLAGIPGTKVKESPGMRTHFKNRAIKAGINFDHFKYQRNKQVVQIPETTPVEQTK